MKIKIIESDECDQCNREVCEAYECQGCGDIYRDCDGECLNDCGEVS